MNPQNTLLHEVVITAIIVKDSRFLITKRVATKKRFPNMWTIPGGKLETTDYMNTPKETKDYWYNVLEKTLAREVWEEVGLTIKNISYVTSLATIHADGTPSIVITVLADYESGDVVLKTDETDDYAFVSLEDAKQYPLIDGIYDELVLAEKLLQSRSGLDVPSWQKLTE